MDVGSVPFARRRRLRRIGLRLFFTSVACNAAIAIYALPALDFSSTDGKILCVPVPTRSPGWLRR